MIFNPSFSIVKYSHDYLKQFPKYEYYIKQKLLSYVFCYILTWDYIKW